MGSHGGCKPGLVLGCGGVFGNIACVACILEYKYLQDASDAAAQFTWFASQLHLSWCKHTSCYVVLYYVMKGANGVKAMA